MNKRIISKTALGALAAVVLLCCGAIFGSTSARAQSCPDNTGPAPDPATCPWNSDFTTYTYPGTTCNITVYFCWRNCSGYGPQVYVTEVDPDATSDCDGIDPSTMLYDARDAALQNAAGLLNVGVCSKGGSTVVTTYMPACWVAVSNPSSGWHLVNCSNWGCYCQRACDVCYEGGSVGYSITNCTNVGAPSCDCYSIDPALPSTNNQIQIGVCYRLLCN